jgi:hypothetical protein
MTRTRPADVRFYVDADLVGVAKVLVALRPDVTYPGDPGGVLHKRDRPACPVTDITTLDEQWIPVVAAQGWLIVTRDAHIRSYPAELAAVRDSGARMVNLASTDAGTRWEQLRILLHHWPNLEELQAQPGPFIYRATLTRLSAVDLTTGLLAKH